MERLNGFLPGAEVKCAGRSGVLKSLRQIASVPSLGNSAPCALFNRRWSSLNTDLYNGKGSFRTFHGVFRGEDPYQVALFLFVDQASLLALIFTFSTPTSRKCNDGGHYFQFRFGAPSEYYMS